MKPILLLAAAIASPAFAQSRFESDRVWNFNGRAWGDIQLSRTSWRDLVREYDAREYSIHDAALRIIPQNRERLNVYALFEEQSERATVKALRLDYYGDEPSLDDVFRQMEERGEEMWHPARNADWSIVAFRRHGVIAVVKGSGRSRTASTYFLVEPARMNSILSLYASRSDDRQTVDGLLGGRDRGNRSRDFASFGRIQIDARIEGHSPRGLGSDDQREFRSWAEDRFKDDRSGSLRFEDRSSGTVRVTARWADFDRGSDEGDLEIEATFVSRDGGAFEVRDTHHVDVNGNYRRAWESAVSNVIEQLDIETNRQLDSRRGDGRDEDRDRGQRGGGGRQLSMSEALDELARAAVGQKDFARGGRIIGRGGH